MLKDELITYDTAVLAEQKGFNVQCDWCYMDGVAVYAIQPRGSTHEVQQWGKHLYSAPTQSLLQRWLREVHGIHILINIQTRFVKDYGYHYRYTVIDSSGAANSGRYNTYEAALEDGLQAALKLIPDNKTR